MKIYSYPHPILNHKCKPVRIVDDFIKDLAREMLLLVDEHNGLGLSANQVGYPYNLFVTKIDSCPVVINPVISLSGGTDIHTEGCLSVPGLQLQCRRNNRVKLNAYDLQGHTINLQLDGLAARIIQHEYDHLQGIYFLEKAVYGQTHLSDPVIRNLEAKFKTEPFDFGQWSFTVSTLEKERC